MQLASSSRLIITGLLCSRQHISHSLKLTFKFFVAREWLTLSNTIIAPIIIQHMKAKTVYVHTKTDQKENVRASTDFRSIGVTTVII